MELTAQLKQDGIAKGLCRQWQMKIKPGLDTKQLVELFVRGIDFCVNNDYPTLGFLREHFKGDCEPYGVYIDDDVAAINRPEVVLNGKCKGMLAYNDYSVSRAVLRHDTSVNVIVSGNAILTVDIFDDAAMHLVTVGDRATVWVNKYGNSQVSFVGQGVKIMHKHKNRY